MKTGPNFRALQITLKSVSHYASQDEREADLDRKHNRARAAIVARVEREEIRYHTSAQFRRDVIEDLIAEGCTRTQAEGRTRDQARLFVEAARLGAM